jgi:hypothetical protein
MPPEMTVCNKTPKHNKFHKLKWISKIMHSFFPFFLGWRKKTGTEYTPLAAYKTLYAKPRVNLEKTFPTDDT